MRSLEHVVSYIESYIREGGFSQSAWDHYPFWGFLTFLVVTALGFLIAPGAGDSPAKMLRRLSVTAWIVYAAAVIIAWPIIWIVAVIIVILLLFIISAS